MAASQKSVISRLLESLHRQGIGGEDVRQLHYEVNGTPDAETGLTDATPHGASVGATNPDGTPSGSSGDPTQVPPQGPQPGVPPQ